MDEKVIKILAEIENKIKNEIYELNELNPKDSTFTINFEIGTKVTIKI